MPPLNDDDVRALTDAGFFQAMTLAMQNAVATQQRAAVMLEAVSMQGVTTLYSIDTAKLAKGPSVVTPAAPSS